MIARIPLSIRRGGAGLLLGTGAVVLSLASSAPAHSQQPKASEPRTRTAPPAGLLETRKFIADVAATNRFEIEAAQLALEKSRNDAIRRHAQTMIDGHRQLARDMPHAGSTTASLSARQSRTLDQLRQADGAEFDRIYADSQVLGHRAALELHQDYVIDGTDTPVKQAARRAIPHIRQHLEEAQMLQQQIAEVPARSAPADRSPSGQMTPRPLRPGEQAPMPSRAAPRKPPGQLP